MSLTPTAVELNWKVPTEHFSVALALQAVNMQSTAREQFHLSCNIVSIAGEATAGGVGAVLPAIEHKLEVT